MEDAENTTYCPWPNYVGYRKRYGKALTDFFDALQEACWEEYAQGLYHSSIETAKVAISIAPYTHTPYDVCLLLGNVAECYAKLRDPAQMHAYLLATANALPPESDTSTYAESLRTFVLELSEYLEDML